MSIAVLSFEVIAGFGKFVWVYNAFRSFVRSVEFYTCFGSPSVTGLLGSPLLRCYLYLPPSFVADFASLLSLYTGRSDSLTPSTSSGLSIPVSANSPAQGLG